MYTLFIGSRVALSIFFTVALVFSASAHQTIGTDTAEDFSNNLSFDTESYKRISEIAPDLLEIEDLPLVQPVLSSLDWREFGSRLEIALASGHRGLRNSALRLIIAYGENFDLSESAVFDVMRLYRDGDSERLRRMAVVALAQIDSEWAMKFLERSVRFEKSEQVRHTILAILNHQGSRKMST